MVVQSILCSDSHKSLFASKHENVMAAKDVCSKKYNLYVGNGPDAKEVLDSLTRLRESLKFDTNQKFMEWVVQTISSPQNEEPRNLTIINAKNSSHETVATPTEHC